MEKAVVLNGEGGDGKFSSFLIFSPLFDFFSQHFFLHCYLVSYNGCSLSVHQGNKGLPPQSPPCKLCGEGGDGKFSSCFFSPFQFFHSIFSRYGVIQLAVSAALPQSIKGTRARHHHLLP
jgi:hypothetical protein